MGVLWVLSDGAEAHRLDAPDTTATLLAPAEASGKVHQKVLA